MEGHGLTMPASIHDRLVAGVRQVLQEGAHPGLQYRATSGDAWADIVGDASFHPDRPDFLGFSDDDKDDMLPSTGTLKISDVDGNTALADKYQVKAMGQTWAVLGLSRHNGKRLYRCKRTGVASGTGQPFNRGGAR